MSSDFERLRRLVNEELDKLDEYRPNAFMLSHMEEQDQDGDGDEDFDDVRVARYTKGGMTRDQALAKVKRKPMGKKGSKREDVSLSESMQRMTARERIALHEAVKHRILLTEAGPIEITDGKYKWKIDGNQLFMTATPKSKSVTSNNPKEITDGKTKSAILSKLKQDYPGSFSAADSATERGIASTTGDASGGSTSPPAAAVDVARDPADTSPVNSTVKMGDTELFRKTDEGWKTTMRATIPQILSLVKPANRATVEKQLKDASGQGDKVPLRAGILLNPALETTFQRDGDVFADPRIIPGETIKKIVDNDKTRLRYEAAKTAGGATAASSEPAKIASSGGGENTKVTVPVGDAKIVLTPDEAQIIVKDDPNGRFTGFLDIFGQDSEIADRIQQAATTKKPSVLKLPLSLALEGSVMKKFSNSLFKFLNIGKVRFELKGGEWICTVTGEKRVERIRKALEDLRGLQPGKIASPSQARKKSEEEKVAKEKAAKKARTKSKDGIVKNLEKIDYEDVGPL